MKRPRTLEDWRAAIERAGATLRKEGAGFRFAPCPACGGGSRDSAWVRPGRAGVLAGCNGGCKLPALAGALFPTPGRRAPAPPPGGYARLDRASGPPSDGADFPALAETLAETLTLGPGARQWIAGRGLDPDRLAGCGWRSVESPEARAILRAARRESGAGLPGAAWTALREGRPLLVMPLFDGDGRPASVRVRALLDGGGPKSLRGPKSLPGDTGRLIGGPWDIARTLHICEGESDTATLAAAGAEAVAGLPGAGSLHEQAVALARRVEARGLALWMDGDESGRNAAAALAAKLAAVGVDSRPVFFAPGMDCNDLWRADPGQLRAAVQRMEATKWPKRQQAA